MSGVGHTPGPWFRTEAGWTIRAPARPYISASGREMSLRTDVALIHRVGGYPGEREANARLIAAAPDLLAALQHIADLEPVTDQHGFSYDAAQETARAAITQATEV